ncbi:MAG: hypothetical protein CSA09_04125 [Candidatus Contendobacter odensis]|uniref:Putative beta-barrel assembly-enhancing protease n=1 Tax=Candidatus Contendibacter odensensis TaxID=1400860 RepID=A0A2G6PEJ2_9GAMM|nr:MAG: hypothetical protein CSA09_04125 [Candidatus Contendobacter odensis]
MPNRSLPLSLGLLLSVLTAMSPSAAQSILLPDIGDPAQAYFSSNEEQQLGLEIMRRLRQHDRVIDDVQLNEYIHSIGQRIAAYTDQHHVPFQFFMLRDSSINAFALPYNFVGINIGLLLATQREDELAGVIAHEIAHISQRHIVRAIADTRRLTLPIAAAMIASAALATAHPQAGQAAMATTMATSAQHQISFTRANEQEADRIGIQLLAKSGFDPAGMTDFFLKMERLAGGSNNNQIPEILLTHPRPASRVADTRHRINTPARQRGTLHDHKAYYLAKARARVLIAEDTHTLLQNIKTRLTRGDFNHKTAERYAYTLALRQSGRYDEAWQQINRLLKHDPDRLAFRIEAAEIALAQNNRALAWNLFEKTRQLYPDDFTLAIHYSRALTIQEGDPGKAMRLLRPHLRRRSNNLLLYETYAQAAQRAGDRVATHATMAEYHYLNGEQQAAIEQLEIGLKKPGLSPNQEARLRARLKQIKAEAGTRNSSPK